MKIHNQLVKYKNNPIKKWFTNIFNRVKTRFGSSLFGKIKNKFRSSIVLDKDTKDKINREFPKESEQREVTALLKDLLTRNRNLLETLDIRMLNKDIVDLFGKANLERIITDYFLQRNILELSKEQLQTYAYVLNYNLVDFNERIGNLNPHSCQNINFDELQSLDETNKLKSINILLSNSMFCLNNLSELDDYYEKRKKMCQEIIDNPKRIEEEIEKEMNSKTEITNFPFGLLYEMQSLTEIDRVKYAIIETKYGMSLEKALLLCKAFGEDINEIEQSENTRVISELNSILKENDINVLKQIDLDENYNNYEGTLNILPNLKNAYLHKYQETLYQISEDDYIGTQSVKTKEKKSDVKIYNILGKNNDRADFNLILTSLRRNLRW